MGDDANIYFEHIGVFDMFEPVIDGCILERPVARDDDWYGPDGATHKVETLARWADPSYGMSGWPKMSATLMMLLAHPKIKRVWYYGNEEPDKVIPVTVDYVLDVSRQYMTDADRHFYALPPPPQEVKE